MMIATAFYAGHVIYEAGGMGNIIESIQTYYATHSDLTANNVLAVTNYCKLNF